MNILFFLVPIAIFISAFFTLAFIWAVKSGQFDDLDTATHRVLINDQPKKSNEWKGNNGYYINK